MLSGCGGAFDIVSAVRCGVYRSDASRQCPPLGCRAVAPPGCDWPCRFSIVRDSSDGTHLVKDGMVILDPPWLPLSSTDLAERGGGPGGGIVARDVVGGDCGLRGACARGGYKFLRV